MYSFFFSLSNRGEAESSKIRGQISAIQSLSYHGNIKSSRFHGLWPAIQASFYHGNVKPSQSRGLWAKAHFYAHIVASTKIFHPLMSELMWL